MQIVLPQVVLRPSIILIWEADRRYNGIRQGLWYLGIIHSTIIAVHAEVILKTKEAQSKSGIGSSGRRQTQGWCLTSPLSCTTVWYVCTNMSQAINMYHVGNQCVMQVLHIRFRADIDVCFLPASARTAALVLRTVKMEQCIWLLLQPSGLLPEGQQQYCYAHQHRWPDITDHELAWVDDIINRSWATDMRWASATIGSSILMSHAAYRLHSCCMKL